MDDKINDVIQHWSYFPTHKFNQRKHEKGGKKCKFHYNKKDKSPSSMSCSYLIMPVVFWCFAVQCGFCNWTYIDQ